MEGVINEAAAVALLAVSRCPDAVRCVSFTCAGNNVQTQVWASSVNITHKHNEHEQSDNKN